MQRIHITTSLSSEPYEPLTGYRGHMVLKNLWKITFEFRYYNAKGDIAMQRTLEYRLETAHGWPFPEREISRMRVDVRRQGPYNNIFNGIRDVDTGPFLFDEDHEILLEDAGEVLTFFEGVFSYEDMAAERPTQKQLTHERKSLPAGDR